MWRRSQFGRKLKTTFFFYIKRVVVVVVAVDYIFNKIIVVRYKIKVVFPTTDSDDVSQRSDNWKCARKAFYCMYFSLNDSELQSLNSFASVSVFFFFQYIDMIEMLKHHHIFFNWFAVYLMDDSSIILHPLHCFYKIKDKIFSIINSLYF